MYAWYVQCYCWPLSRALIMENCRLFTEHLKFSVFLRLFSVVGKRKHIKNILGRFFHLALLIRGKWYESGWWNMIKSYCKTKDENYFILFLSCFSINFCLREITSKSERWRENLIKYLNNRGEKRHFNVIWGFFFCCCVVFVSLETALNEPKKCYVCVRSPKEDAFEVQNVSCMTHNTKFLLELRQKSNKNLAIKLRARFHHSNLVASGISLRFFFLFFSLLK